jgi:hypothetical protein
VEEREKTPEEQMTGCHTQHNCATSALGTELIVSQSIGRVHEASLLDLICARNTVITWRVLPKGHRSEKCWTGMVASGVQPLWQSYVRTKFHLASVEDLYNTRSRTLLLPPTSPSKIHSRWSLSLSPLFLLLLLQHTA